MSHPPPPILLEVLATSIGAVRLALAGGAGRIELCENDPMGGTTPSAGTIHRALELAHAVRVPVNVMIRPRGGGFVFDSDERAVMLKDVTAAVRAGADGVVSGALTADGHLDRDLTSRLLDAAQGLPVTFHRAVDVAPDTFAAATAAFDLGCTRVLTSGGAPDALAGSETIARLVRTAPGGRAVIAGGRITSASVAELVARTGVREIHVAARTIRSDGSSQPTGAGATVGSSQGIDSGWPAPDPDELKLIRSVLGA